MLRLVILAFCVNSVFSANPNYSYHVKIEDPAYANFQQKAETRLGEKTEGFYSVVQPDGGLRTVKYFADESGYHPTITYSYGHPVPAVKKVLATPAIVAPAVATAPAVALGGTVVKQHAVPAASYQQVFAPAGHGAYATFTGSPNHYATEYGTPVFSVRDSRQFIKSPLVAQQAAALLAAPVAYQQQPVFAQFTQLAQPGYAYPAPAPVQVAVPEQKVEYLPPPAAAEPVVVPEQKVEYLPPPAAPAKVTEPAPTPVAIPAQKLEYLPPRQTKVVQEGYAYPVPQVKFEYPAVQKVKVQTAVVKQPAVIKAVEPAPAVIKAQLPQVHQYVEFGARIQPQLQFIAQQPQYIAPQPQYIARQPQYIAPQPQFIQQPQYIAHQPQFIQQQYATPIQYTHTPAQVFHQQAHFQEVQKVIQAAQPQFHYAPDHLSYAAPEQPIVQQQAVEYAQPAPQPQVVQKYEDIIVQNQGVMRYAAAPVAQFLPATQVVQQQYVQPPPQPAVVQKVHVQQPQYLVQKAVAPAPAPTLVKAAPALIKGKQNPLTFNYGYDNGVSKVTHSYYGSGW